MPSDRDSRPAQHVLLVEDDEGVRRSLTLLLRSWGYTVDVFRSGAEVLSLRKLPTPDCMVIDYKMPHLDGLDLLPQLRAAGMTAPAILITGFYSNSLADRAKKLGFCSVIEKPSVNEDLQLTLKTHLQAA